MTTANKTPITVLLTAELLDKLRPYQQTHAITSVSEAILTILHTHLDLDAPPTPPFSYLLPPAVPPPPPPPIRNRFKVESLM